MDTNTNLYKIYQSKRTLLSKTVACCAVFASLSWAAHMTIPTPIYYDGFITFGISKSRSATIAHNEFNASQGAGQVVSNVNIINGQPIYQVPLMGINARGILSWNLSLTYNGSGILPTLYSSNQQVNAGLYGLGWSMSSPYVAVSHMGTVSTMDDAIYCDLGPYGGGQIVQNSSGDFFLSTNPYIKIKANLGLVAGKTQILSWLFTMPDGNKMFFGESSNSKRTQRSRGNVIAAHPSTTSQGEDFVYKYDLSRFTNFDQSTEIDFEYSQVRESVGSESYVRESAPSAIYWRSSGVTVDSIAFIYTDKDANEYTGFGLNEPKDSQRLFESRYLSQMKRFVGKTCEETMTFSHAAFTSNVDDFHFLKELVGIRDSVSNGEARDWTFYYDPNVKMLNRVLLPDYSTEEFSYDTLDIGSSVHAPGVPDVMRDASGNAVATPATGGGTYENSAQCMEQYCAAMLTVDGGGSSNVNLYLQVYQNSGNYFSDPINYEAFGKQHPFVSYSSNYSCARIELHRCLLAFLHLIGGILSVDLVELRFECTHLRAGLIRSKNKRRDDELDNNRHQ